MSFGPEFNVAICGAGLGGLGLALALHSHSIPCTIYESSDKPERVIGGSLQISGNGQSVFERYGIMGRLARHGCFSDTLKVMDGQGNRINEFIIGDREVFGHSGMRIIRSLLMAELLASVREHGIEINCNKKFVRLLSDSTAEGVRFEFADGTVAQASLLVGADGIHSRVRHCLFPDAETQYLGTFAAGGSVARAALSDGLTSGEEFTSEREGMLVGGYGAFILLPHDPQKSEYLAVLQKPYPDLGREGFNDMLSDKRKLHAYLNEDRSDWPKYIQNAIDNIREDTMWVWPTHVLPKLPSWRSSDSQVVLIGDAAHAMPPSAGQGANMAFEDGYTLGLVLASKRGAAKLDEALTYWQELRQERIDAVLALAMRMNELRLPMAKGQKSPNGESAESVISEKVRNERLGWLFCGVPGQEEKIKAWASQ